VRAPPAGRAHGVTTPEPGSSERDRTKVLYIAGAGRSASTLVGQILGQIDAFCYVGEVIYAWRTFHLRRCGCRDELERCRFWAAVRCRAGGTGQPLAAPELFGFARLARWRHLPSTLARRPKLPEAFRAPWSLGERLYRTMADVAEARVVVDSSKNPVYGRML